MKLGRRMVVVANRLPVTVQCDAGQYRLEPTSGGLVTALRPVLRENSGVWIGWTGTEYSPEVEELLQRSQLEGSFSMRPVFLTAEERTRFYCGFSNEILWPLFHDLQSRCNFDPLYWDTYLQVNERFAASVASEAGVDDFIWVHDYHLMATAACLRRMGSAAYLAYFHHIPFPSPDIFEKLPWRAEVLTALLDFDALGFQTVRDQRNFVSCVRRFVPAATIQPRGDQLRINEPGRTTLVGTFPISIDFDEFADGALQEQVAQRAADIRRDLAGCQIVLGVDRLDYTKGIPELLQAFRDLLVRHPEVQHAISLLQVVVPSREDIPKYAELKLLIQRMVSEINGQFGGPGWVPVHYVHRPLERPELLAYYRAADIALITPLKDGMNLVSKEFCAAKVDGDGVLVLSEFAGAAPQLGAGALLVNPYDARAVAGAIYRAYQMAPQERRQRMRKLRRNVQRHNIFRWCGSFCEACFPALGNALAQDAKPETLSALAKEEVV